MTIENRRNYYRILHVQPDAPVEIIRSSYRTLMQRLKMHPDLGGDHWNASLINEAYQVLTSPDDRARYDRERALDERMRTMSDEPATPGSHTDSAGPAPHAAAAGSCLFCHAPHDRDPATDPDAMCPRCDSPLGLADNLRLEDEGQRAVRRIDRRMRLTYFSQWPQTRGWSGQTRDVSLNGMSFITRHPVREGGRLKIVSEVLDAVVWVTHCHPETTAAEPCWIVGAAFETLRYRRTRGAFLSVKA